jgi:hypothetical protein
MDAPYRIDTSQAILLMTLIGAAIGLVLGLVPLIYGRIKGKTRLGVIGFVVSIAAGAVWSILPLFVMITFVFLIIRDPKPAPAPDDEPVEVSSGADDTE